MKYFKTKNILVAVLLVLMSVACILSVKFMTKSAGAKTEDSSEEYNTCCATYSEQSITPYSYTTDALHLCLDYDGYRTSHGDGRENGGTSLLNVGCRNYKGQDDNYTYGTTNISYWINMNEMNAITNSSVRENLINRIRVQAGLWNQAYMYDGTGKFVNFYEVTSIDGSRPQNIDGRPVIEVKPYSFIDTTKEGSFDPNDFSVNIGCNFSGTVLSSSVQVPAQEFGHVLGLDDLDTKSNKTHSVLMGYKQNINKDNLHTVIHYQDIQGAALINGKHVCADSHYKRYKYQHGQYYHICFYCDHLFVDTSIKPGSQAITEVCAEGSHNYQPMVACGNIRWDKCTKCYKVVAVNLQNEIDDNVYLAGYGAVTPYDISIHSINAQYGSAMPATSLFAPEKSGYSFTGFCDASGKKYYEMRVVNDPQSADIHMQGTYYVEKPFPVSGVKWDHNVKVTLYPVWEPIKCNYTYQNVCDGKVLSTTTTVLTHGKNFISPISINDYKFKYFEYNDVQYSSVPAEIYIPLYRSSSGNIVPKYSFLTAYYEDDSCLAAGSMITLADGSQKAVENLTGDEMLLVWNLYTGSYDVAPILFIDSEPLSTYSVINLSFSDGTTVKVISEHGFWDCDLNKYVYLDKDAEKYIGHRFKKGDTQVTLTGVEIKQEYTSAWSPVTYGHLCYYVNGMLSMPGGIDGMFNIFEVDGQAMKYDEALMQADIEEYGLFTYEEFAEYVELPEEVFEAFNGQYLKVAIGKGLITIDKISSLYERYSELLTN